MNPTQPRATGPPRSNPYAPRPRPRPIDLYTDPMATHTHVALFHSTSHSHRDSRVRERRSSHHQDQHNSSRSPPRTSSRRSHSLHPLPSNDQPTPPASARPATSRSRRQPTFTAHTSRFFDAHLTPHYPTSSLPPVTLSTPSTHQHTPQSGGRRTSTTTSPISTTGCSSPTSTSSSIAVSIRTFLPPFHLYFPQPAPTTLPIPTPAPAPTSNAGLSTAPPDPANLSNTTAEPPHHRPDSIHSNQPLLPSGRPTCDSNLEHSMGKSHYFPNSFGTFRQLGLFDGRYCPKSPKLVNLHFHWIYVN